MIRRQIVCESVELGKLESEPYHVAVRERVSEPEEPPVENRSLPARESLLLWELERAAVISRDDFSCCNDLSDCICIARQITLCI